MKRKLQVMSAAFLLLLLCAGCSVGITQQEEGRELEFTVVARSELPQEVESVLDEQLGTSFQTACQYGDSLYLLCGYPPQAAGGYSIRVNKLKATEDAIYFQAELVGPDTSETTESSGEDSISAPWIAVKTEYLDLPVIFEP